MIKWKNRDFNELGIVNEKIPTISKGKKKIDIHQIEGRNGFISIDTNSYEPFNLTLECHCNENANIDEIKEFLDGYGTLSFDNQRQYTAVINNAIPFEQVINFKKFQVSFLVNPIAEDIVATEIDLIENDEFNITTYSDIYPMLEITCSGDVSITINNHTFMLNDSDGTYILDCKNKVIVDSNGNNAAGIMQYDFPKFINGNNTVETSGTITNFVASYRKTYQ